jgi:hypothetical protein
MSSSCLLQPTCTSLSHLSPPKLHTCTCIYVYAQTTITVWGWRRALVQEPPPSRGVCPHRRRVSSLAGRMAWWVGRFAGFLSWVLPCGLGFPIVTTKSLVSSASGPLPCPAGCPWLLPLSQSREPLLPVADCSHHHRAPPTFQHPSQCVCVPTSGAGAPLLPTHNHTPIHPHTLSRSVQIWTPKTCTAVPPPFSSQGFLVPPFPFRPAGPAMTTAASCFWRASAP